MHLSSSNDIVLISVVHFKQSMIHVVKKHNSAKALTLALPHKAFWLYMNIWQGPEGRREIKEASQFS